MSVHYDSQLEMGLCPPPELMPLLMLSLIFALPISIPFYTSVAHSTNLLIMELVKSRRGNDMVVLNGYIFSKEKANKNGTGIQMRHENVQLTWSCK